MNITADIRHVIDADAITPNCCRILGPFTGCSLVLHSEADAKQGHHHNDDQATRRPRYDVFNLWLPIYDPSVWGTRGSVSGMSLLMYSSAPYSNIRSISNHLATISKVNFSTPPPGLGCQGVSGGGRGRWTQSRACLWVP